jgi:hypothetical protein
LDLIFGISLGRFIEFVYQYPQWLVLRTAPLEAVALLTFIQSPNVATILSQYERSMQNAQWLTFLDEGGRDLDARRWRPADELPTGADRLKLISAMLRIAADTKRRGVERGVSETTRLIRQEIEKKAA